MPLASIFLRRAIALASPAEAIFLNFNFIGVRVVRTVRGRALNNSKNESKAFSSPLIALVVAPTRRDTTNAVTPNAPEISPLPISLPSDARSEVIRSRVLRDPPVSVIVAISLNSMGNASINSCKSLPALLRKSLVFKSSASLAYVSAMSAIEDRAGSSSLVRLASRANFF